MIQRVCSEMRSFIKKVLIELQYFKDRCLNTVEVLEVAGIHKLYYEFNCPCHKDIGKLYFVKMQSGKTALYKYSKSEAAAFNCDWSWHHFIFWGYQIQ